MRDGEVKGVGCRLCANNLLRSESFIATPTRRQQVTRPILLSLALLLLTLTGAISASSDAEHLAYRHAYYLFLAGTPNGCEDCYVPLLITTESVEQIAQGRTDVACPLIITYERDSIWHNEGLVSVAPGDIEKGPRVLRLRGRRYRYQEISLAEAVRLLQNPLGSIPISRPQLSPGAPGPSVEAIASALQSAK